MFERGAQMMREDMEALGPVKVKGDVEAAQQEIIAVLRVLEAEGVVSSCADRWESSMLSKLLRGAALGTVRPYVWRFVRRFGRARESVTADRQAAA